MKKLLLHMLPLNYAAILRRVLVFIGGVIAVQLPAQAIPSRVEEQAAAIQARIEAVRRNAFAGPDSSLADSNGESCGDEVAQWYNWNNWPNWGNYWNNWSNWGNGWRNF